MTPPFVVYALPRSRTFWLSRFLCYAEWNCGHDEIRHARSLDDVRAWFSQSYTGTVETAAAPWWRLIQRLRPDCACRPSERVRAEQPKPVTPCEAQWRWECPDEAEAYDNE